MKKIALLVLLLSLLVGVACRKGEEGAESSVATVAPIVEAPSISAATPDPLVGQFGCAADEKPQRMLNPTTPLKDQAGNTLCVKVDPSTGGEVSIWDAPVISATATPEGSALVAVETVAVSIAISDVTATGFKATATCIGECTELAVQWVEKRSAQEIAQEKGVTIPEELEGLVGLADSVINSFWVGAQELPATSGQAVQVTGLTPETIYLVRARAAEGSSEPVEVATLSQLGIFTSIPSWIWWVLGGLVLLGLIIFVVRRVRRGGERSRSSEGRSDTFNW